MKKAYIYLICLLMAGVGATQAAAQTITKCQDADGKWHYGDHAAQECEATFSELSATGNKLRDSEAPPTQEELDAEILQQKLAKQEAEQAKEKAAERQQLLGTYESEESIIRARDQRLAAIDRTIRGDQELKDFLHERLAALENQTSDEAKLEKDDLTDRIKEYDQSIMKRMSERQLVGKRYDEDLSRFRAIMQSQQ